MWNTPPDSKTAATQIVAEIQKIREEIIRLQEQRKGDLVYHRKLEEIDTSLNELLITVRDNTIWINEQKASQEKRADRLASGSYGVVFNWIQAILTAIALAFVSWLVTHSQPKIEPTQQDNGSEIK